MAGLTTIFLALLLSTNSFASTTCQALIKDLRGMQAAQKQLMSSFVKKNDTMAQVLDENADQLDKQMNLQKSLRRSDLKALRMSAKAFRGHEAREKELISRFEKASGELMDQIESCLRKDSDLVSQN